MHKLQVFVAGLYVLPLSSVFQSIVYVEPLCLIFQMCVLNVVSVLYFSFLKDLRWFPYLCLNGGAVSPTYFSTFCVFSFVVSVTVAWYIMFSERHLASRGQGVFLGQLHIYIGEGRTPQLLGLSATFRLYPKSSSGLHKNIKVITGS